MRNLLLLGLYFVLSLKEVFTESENEIKRGAYPFVAIVYYQDKSITGPSGARFARSAVLFRKEWLVSSSLVTNETQLAFPRKTLLARVGAISLDANFSLNEDEDEQEREIIKIIQPTNFSTSQWWYNDITLLKTLLPFNITNAVAITTLSGKPDMDKSCYILVFAKKYTNSSDEKLLRQLSVELSPPSKESCGVYFRNETMICATDSDEIKNVYDPYFCDGNSGGALMCEGDVIGLQTYIGNNCKSPYLYQSLSAWEDFIVCGVEEKCLLEHCNNICEVIDKDDVIIATTKQEVTAFTTKVAKEIAMEQSNEDSSDEERFMSTETGKQIAITESGKPTPTTSPKVEITTTKTTRTPVAITESDERNTRFMNSQNNWPKEKYVEHRKKLDDGEDSDKIERKTNVEAQLDEVKKKGRSAAIGPATGKVALCHSLFLGLLFKSL